MLQTAWLLPQKGFRRWASIRPVSRPSRQPATGPPGSYPDGTRTRWRRRAYVGITYSISTLQPWAHSRNRGSTRLVPAARRVATRRSRRHAQAQCRRSGFPRAGQIETPTFCGSVPCLSALVIARRAAGSRLMHRVLRRPAVADVNRRTLVVAGEPRRVRVPAPSRSRRRAGLRKLLPKAIVSRAKRVFRDDAEARRTGM